LRTDCRKPLRFRRYGRGQSHRLHTDAYVNEGRCLLATAILYLNVAALLARFREASDPADLTALVQDLGFDLTAEELGRAWPSLPLSDAALEMAVGAAVPRTKTCDTTDDSPACDRT
jgi:hypothetical protein